MSAYGGLFSERPLSINIVWLLKRDLNWVKINCSCLIICYIVILAEEPKTSCTIIDGMHLLLASCLGRWIAWIASRLLLITSIDVSSNLKFREVF